MKKVVLVKKNAVKLLAIAQLLGMGVSEWFEEEIDRAVKAPGLSREIRSVD